MSKIFLSHCSKNGQLAEVLTECMHEGIGVEEDDVFCSSMNYSIPSGEDFTKHIKDELDKCQIVIAMIIPEYLKSIYCLMELGAAWILPKKVFLMLVGGVSYEQLNNTPYQGRQMNKIKNENDLYFLCDELRKSEMLFDSNNLNVSNLVRKAKEFIQVAQGET